MSNKLIDLKRIKRLWSYNPVTKEVAVVVFDTEFDKPVTSIAKYAGEEQYLIRMISAISIVLESFKTH